MINRSNFIREWREAANFTQEMLAEALGISKGYMSDLERGKKRYNQTILERVAATLSCTPADLIAGAPEAKSRMEFEIDDRFLQLSVEAAIKGIIQNKDALDPPKLARVSATTVRLYKAYLSQQQSD